MVMTVRCKLDEGQTKGGYMTKYQKDIFSCEFWCHYQRAM